MQSDSVNQEDWLSLVRVCERHCPNIKRPILLEATLPHCNTNSYVNKICPSHPFTCASPTSDPDKGQSWNSQVPFAWHKPCPLLYCTICSSFEWQSSVQPWNVTTMFLHPTYLSTFCETYLVTLVIRAVCFSETLEQTFTTWCKKKKKKPPIVWTQPSKKPENLYTINGL